MQTAVQIPARVRLTWTALLYFAHAFLASLGATLLAFGLESLIERLDNAIPIDKLDTVFWGPTFAFPILIGALLGMCFGGRLSRLAARLLLVFPLLQAAFAIAQVIHETNLYESVLPYLQHRFLAHDCGSFLCNLGQMGITAPLFSSIAYMIGSEGAASIIRLRKASTKTLE